MRIAARTINRLGSLPLFIVYALVVACLYLPATRAGFVSDYTGWLQSLREHSFEEYITRSRFQVKSLYHVTQAATWVLYQVLGTSRWAWHLLFVIWHAFNAGLFATIIRRTLRDGGIDSAAGLSAVAGLLFAINPYATEVVVWEASYHYLQSASFIFVILLLVQQHLHRPRLRYIIIAALLYAVSTFTHESFYLTPPLAALLILYYRFGFGWDGARCRTTAMRFLPLLFLILFFHLLLYRALHGDTVAHVGNEPFSQPWTYFAVKAPYYFFHLFALGRFWPDEWKGEAYRLLRSPVGASLFYLTLLLSILLPLIRFGRMNALNRAAFWTYCALLLTLALFVPLWFPDSLLVMGDRYTYLMLPWWSALVVMLGSILSPRRVWLSATVFLIAILCAVTLRTTLMWGKSARMVDRIQNQLRPTGGRVALLLNIPACYRGIPMIGSSREGETRLMHNLLYEPTLTDTVFDVSSYNMTSGKDGAYVQVIDDSTARVTLAQWGTWWWEGPGGASSYETEYYKVDMRDVGHWYELRLKKPASHFVMFYCVGDTLKEVDWSLRGAEQR